MSKEEILSYFYTNSTNYGVKSTLVILLCGLCAGMIIYLTYYVTSEKVVYNRKFNWSLVAFLLITIIIMLMISSNIAISLGMVGALSIVRFRTAVKDSRDTVFIFLGNGRRFVYEFAELSFDIYICDFHCNCFNYFK